LVIEWIPDTCDCVVIVNNNYQWIETIKKCRLHKSFNGQILVDTIKLQNRRFNMALGINPDEIDLDEIALSKDVNIRRIRLENLDNYHEHLAEHHTRTFFENLKRIIGRLNPL